MSIGDELKDGLHPGRPHKLKGATHHLFIQAWESVDQSRKVIYENLRLPLPATLPVPEPGTEQGILVQLLYERYIRDEVEAWTAEAWRAAAAQADPKMLEHLILAATSYECANAHAATALLDAYRKSRLFKERFLYHIDHFVCGPSLTEPPQEGPPHLNLTDGRLIPKKKKKKKPR